MGEVEISLPIFKMNKMIKFYEDIALKLMLDTKFAAIHIPNGAYLEIEYNDSTSILKIDKDQVEDIIDLISRYQEILEKEKRLPTVLEQDLIEKYIDLSKEEVKSTRLYLFIKENMYAFKLKI